MSTFGANHGVKLALEMHPGFVVYNTESMIKLRKHCGKNIGANFDPSHLFWQGIDPVFAIKTLKDAIIHVHANDSALDEYIVRFRGVNDWKHYSDVTNRAWTFRTVGYGHDIKFWKDFISSLRLIGYDGAISIEHEDPLMSVDEGLGKAIEFLNKVLLFEKPCEIWWA